jgi:hypothetical protein
MFNIGSVKLLPTYSEARQKSNYGLHKVGTRVRAPVFRDFFSPHRPGRLRDQPSLLSSGVEATIFSGIMRPERVVDHSRPASAEVRNRALSWHRNGLSNHQTVPFSYLNGKTFLRS